jgi:hypothetical protein
MLCEGENYGRKCHLQRENEAFVPPGRGLGPGFRSSPTISHIGMCTYIHYFEHVVFIGIYLGHGMYLHNDHIHTYEYPSPVLCDRGTLGAWWNSCTVSYICRYQRCHARSSCAGSPDEVGWLHKRRVSICLQRISTSYSSCRVRPINES